MYAIGLENERKIVGAVIVGRPIAKIYCDGYTAEVKRLVTDGTDNACSMLYAAAWRAAKALGYNRLLTYTLATESGASLRASGWRLDGETAGLSQVAIGNFAELKNTGKKERVFTGKKKRWILEVPNRPTDKEPFYFPHPENDLIHRPAALVFPPTEAVITRGGSETSDTPSIQEGETGATPEPPHPSEARDL
jgi:hypothetical protein